MNTLTHHYGFRYRFAFALCETRNTCCSPNTLPFFLFNLVHTHIFSTQIWMATRKWGAIVLT